MFFNRKISTHTLWSKGYEVISDQQLMIPLIRRVSRLYRNLNEKNHSLQNRLKRKAMPGSNIRRLLPDSECQELDQFIMVVIGTNGFYFDLIQLIFKSRLKTEFSDF